MITNIDSQIEALTLDKVQTNFRTRKSFIDFLYYDLGRQWTNFRICCAWIGDDGKRNYSRWKRYLDAQRDLFFCSKANNRTLLINEIVLDYDQDKDDPKSWETYLEIIQNLKDRGLKLQAYATKSRRARHIHLFFGVEFASKPREERNKIRLGLAREFHCDLSLASDNHMIPLEHTPHWKTKEIKSLLGGV